MLLFIPFTEGLLEQSDLIDFIENKWLPFLAEHLKKDFPDLPADVFKDGIRQLASNVEYIKRNMPSVFS
jgi:hypothetical protein